jgi:hypothetical protein
LLTTFAPMISAVHRQRTSTSKLVGDEIRQLVGCALPFISLRSFAAEERRRGNEDGFEGEAV